MASTAAGDPSFDSIREKLESRYAPHADWPSVVTPERVAAFKPQNRYWRTAAGIAAARAPSDPPLSGLHVAFDPGHWGGEWAALSDRDFRIEDGYRVREGELVLEVARLAKDRLEQLGARVSLVREDDKPLVPKPEDPSFADEIAANRAWTRADIQARADCVNGILKPDVLIALHIDAVPWPTNEKRDNGGPRPAEDLADANHLHVLVFGAVMAGELEDEEQVPQLLEKLLNGSGIEELRLGRSMVEAFVEKTGLPPFRYSGINAVSLDDSGYLWGRNLMMPRLVRCPTVFLEPYAANGKETHARIQQALASRSGPGKPGEDDILIEYADAVVDGLVRYYSGD